MGLKFISLTGFLILVLILAYLLKTHSLFGHEPISIGLQVVAVLLMLWARVTFGRRSFHAAAEPTAGALITSGPYRYLRHPIYAAILLFMLTGIVANWTLTNALLSLAVIAAVLMRVIAEERLLRARYPEYAEYSRRTKRLIPFVY